MRVYRGIAIAALDGLLGWVLYLSSTNRAFLNPPSTAERVEAATRILDSARSKVSAVGVIKNTVNRDTDLRNKNQEYWVHEGRLMGDLMEEREVVVGINNALENRINMQSIEADAAAYADYVVAS